MEGKAEAVAKGEPFDHKLHNEHEPHQRPNEPQRQADPVGCARALDALHRLQIVKVEVRRGTHLTERASVAFLAVAAARVAR